MKNAKPPFFLALALLLGVLCSAGSAHALGTMRPFTLADEIGLTSFGGAESNPDPSSTIRYSPDKSVLAVFTARGDLKHNRVEDSLRLYRSRDIERFLQHPSNSQQPSALWVITASRGTDGAIDRGWRWLPNSNGIAFIKSSDDGSRRLVLADTQKRIIEPLTPVREAVEAFDIRDRLHYVYTIPATKRAVRPSTATIGTGLSITQLLFPNSASQRIPRGKSTLWAVIGGRHSRIMLVPPGGAENGRSYALSPDGHWVVTVIPVSVPPQWETLYSPLLANYPFRIHTGQLAEQYVLIDLQTHLLHPVTDAPIAINAGWRSDAAPNWSDDGAELLLPNTFLRSKAVMPQPCVAVVNLRSKTEACVEALKGITEAGDLESGFHFVSTVRFAGSDKQHITISFINPRSVNSDADPAGSTEYELFPNGAWEAIKHFNDLDDATGPNGLRALVHQGLNDPPRLTAVENGSSRVIWDPNPQLQNIELSRVSVYNWQDNAGRNWRGDLFMPYSGAARYPLVIQTHYFTDNQFVPSGGFTTAMAAQVFAGSGIAVLQIGGLASTCPNATPAEGPCYVAGIEAAVQKLVRQGLVDPSKIGVIGFSRTGFHVMELLTSSSLHMKAALIADSSMVNYTETVLSQFYSMNDSIIGAPPVGPGLEAWLKTSPGFNLDKVTAPLLVAPNGPQALLTMWEAYSVLHYIGNPVDLIMLNTDEHVITNPAERMASQGGSVDWFRFWLQGYEDPNPTKRAQYKRWEGLRMLQGPPSAGL